MVFSVSLSALHTDCDFDLVHLRKAAAKILWEMPLNLSDPKVQRFCWSWSQELPQQVPQLLLSAMQKGLREPSQDWQRKYKISEYPRKCLMVQAQFSALLKSLGWVELPIARRNQEKMEILHLLDLFSAPGQNWWRHTLQGSFCGVWFASPAASQDLQFVPAAKLKWQGDYLDW